MLKRVSSWQRDQNEVNYYQRNIDLQILVDTFDSFAQDGEWMGQKVVNFINDIRMPNLNLNYLLRNWGFLSVFPSLSIIDQSWPFIVWNWYELHGINREMEANKNQLIANFEMTLKTVDWNTC